MKEKDVPLFIDLLGGESGVIRCLSGDSFELTEVVRLLDELRLL